MSKATDSAAAAGQAITPAQHASPTATYFVLPPVDSPTTVTYGTSLLSSPAPTGAMPAFSQQQAIAAAGRQEGISPQIALRVISYDPAAGGPAEPGVTDDLKVSNTLAWLIIFPDTTPALRGPPMSHARFRQLVASLRCDTLFAFDANTGHGIDNEQECGPR